MILDSPIISGSSTVTGNLTVLGTLNASVSGSVTSASYATNAETLDGLDSTSFTTTSSFTAYTASTDASILSSAQNIAILYVSSSLLDSRVTKTEATASSLTTASSSFSTRVSASEASISNLTTASSSFSTRVTNIEEDYATTGSNTFTGPQYVSQASNAIGFSSTASLYTDGGARITKDLFVSGTTYVNNLTVYGTSSIQYITSSQVNIGANIITVNTDTPAVRFGGLSVFDSGSTGLTGSIFWDSENNHWVYSNPSGSSYSGGMLISGPRSSALGSEQGTTNNALMKGQGGDHITSSGVFESGSNVGIGTSSPAYKLDVQGTGRFTNHLISNSPGGGVNAATFYDRTGAVGAAVNEYGTLAAYSGILNNNGDYSSGGSGTPLVFKAGAVEQFRISATNMVVVGTVTATKGYFSSNGASDSTTGLLANASTNDSSTYAAVFGSLNAGYRMVVRADGNVGIGTTSPNATLQVIGNNGNSASAVLRLRDTNTTSRTTRLQFEDYNGTLADGLIDFKIGTAGVASSATLSIGVNSAGLTFNNTNAATFSNNVTISTSFPSLILSRAGTTFQQDVKFQDAGANRWSIGQAVNAVGNTLDFYSYSFGQVLGLNYSTGAATFASSVTATQFNSTGGRGTSFGYKLPDWQIYNTTSGNALAFSNYTSDLLYITSGGNVGIGTSSPYAGTNVTSLTVNATAYAVLALQVGGTFKGGVLGYSDHIDLYSEGYLNFETSATERMRITSGGQFIVGDTSMAYANSIGYVVGFKSAFTGQSIISIARAGQTLASQGMFIGLDTTTSYFWNRDNIAITFGTNDTEKMRITSGGSLLTWNTVEDVYDTNVSSNVKGYWTNQFSTVNGTSKTLLGAAGTTEAIVGFASLNSSSKYIITAGIYGKMISSTAGAETGDLIFYTKPSGSGMSSNERMRITSTGALFLNATTNPLPDNATPQFGMTAATSTDAVNLKHLQNGNNTFNIWQTGTTQHNAIAFYKGDTQANRGNIVVTTSGTSYNTVSDHRLKENIVPLENGLDRLMQLKPSKFNWIETGNESEGFIAHELQEYFPDAVTGEKDAIYSSTGNIKPQSVDYGRITPLLVKAIQELKAQNDALLTRIEQLENK